MKNLSEPFEHTLQDVYFAESALTKALPKAAEVANGKKLKQALFGHLNETKHQIKKLDKVFKSIGKKASGEKCYAMDGSIKETESIIKEPTETAKNAALVADYQAIEHYEISRNGTLREWAKVLGHDEAHDLLTSILDQEKAANSKLTDLAVSDFNRS